jgi:hypothetical protein
MQQQESETNMIKAYLILAHKYPAQLRRLVKSLDDDKSLFYIHIDQSADISKFDNLQPWAGKISFVQREKAEWAGFGLVQAVLNGLRTIAESRHNFSHVILLSGQDYPIKSNEEIRSFLDHHRGTSFMEYFPLPAYEKWPNTGGMYRVNKYYMGMRSGQKFCSKALNFLSRPFPFLQRRIYGDMKPFAGSMWWILSMDAVSYIIRFTGENPGYAAFHKHTFAADEVFFQMILLNEPAKSQVGPVVNSDKRFIKWKDVHASHPDILGSEAVKEALKSDALFARKFDVQFDDYPLDAIDAHRNHPTNKYASSF